MKLTERQLFNFWNKVKILNLDECWEWTGSLKPQGYGQLTLDKKLYYAHRIAWQIANKRDIPKGVQIHHSCDNRKCVNPNHLWSGSQSDNIQDMLKKGRQNIWDMRGENHPMVRLTENEVKAIRLLYKTGKYKQKWLAEKFNISNGHIGRIISGKVWKHI